MMRVLLDVSTSVAWRRPPVGIVRVEQEFARLLLDRPEVLSRFCRFDRATRRHVEVSRDAVEALLTGSGPQSTSHSQPSPETSTGPLGEEPLRHRLRRRVASRLQRLVDRLPGPIQADALQAARSADGVIRSLYWLSLKLRSRDRSSGPPRDHRAISDEPRNPAFVPHQDAVYVSMGLDWEFNDLRTVWHMKRTYGPRAVLFCYDVIPILFPHLTPSDSRDTFARYFVEVAHVADRVVAISQTSRDDYVAFLDEVGAPIPPMRVIHPGSDVRTRACTETFPPRDDLVHRPFVLCVGTIEARKNHELLYHLWERLVAKHGERTPLLVLVGMMGWGTSDLLNRIRLNRTVADKILLFSELPDGALFWLYEHCLFTVFPSHYEGWGLPVVESLALGKPCLASDAPSIVEATQGLVPTIDPLDFMAWFVQLERWLFDIRALEAARATVRGGYRVTSWREQGEALLEVLEEAALRQIGGSARAPEPDAPARVSRA